MDKLSGLASKLGGGSSSSDNTNTNTNTNSDQEDYGDKGLDFIEKKAGYSLSRDQNEKITDGLREGFEKFSGENVPAKFSN